MTTPTEPPQSPNERSTAPPQETAKPLGLALSGGGFRAMLFHLGVVKYLRDVGLLEQVTQITSVSGGSVLAAHLVLYWEDYLGDGFDRRAQELVDFAQFDLRGRIVRRAYSAERLIRFWKSSPTRLLIDYYGKKLYSNEALHRLARPTRNLRILATDLESGKPCFFSHDGLWHPYSGTKEPSTIADQPIALAVAASSAFPVLFSPVILTPRSVGKRREEFFKLTRLFLTDGGVYDNLGLDPFQAPGGQPGFVIVSDASSVPAWASFGSRWSPSKFVKGLQRSYDIAAGRLYDSDERTLRTAAETPVGWVHIRIHRVVRPGSEATVGAPTSPPLVEEQERLKDIRTDFDVFPGNLIRRLVIHGQWVAHATLREVPGLRNRFDSAKWSYYEPRPREGAGGPAHMTVDDYKIAQRRPVRLIAHDAATYLNALSLAVVIVAAIAFWWLSATRVPADVALDIASAAPFEAAQSPDPPWLNDYQVKAISTAGLDKTNGSLSDFQLVRVPSKPFAVDTPSFDARIVAQPGHRLRLQAFRVRVEQGANSYVPLSLTPEGSPNGGFKAYRMTVPASHRGDYLLLVGQIGAEQGTIPPDVKTATALMSLEVL